MITIDGCVLEGGGQIIRIALGLSAILKIPVRIFNIRANRKKPGLAAQHVKGVELLKAMCNAELKGAYIGSSELEFIPKTITGGNYYADCVTAGSIALLLQITLPVAFFASKKTTFELKGGTNCDMAPQIDFLEYIFRPNLNKFDADYMLNIIKRGYFPKGGGHCTATVNPVKHFKAIDLTKFGEIKHFYGNSSTAGTLPIKIAQEFTDAAKKHIKKSFKGDIPVNIDTLKQPSSISTGNCSFIVLCCETTEKCILGASALGSVKVSNHETGWKATDELISPLKINSCVDDYTQDQLLLYMALAEGTSKMRCGQLTLHSTTAIYVIELLTQIKFKITPDNGTNIIECCGLGMKNTQINE